MFASACKKAIGGLSLLSVIPSVSNFDQIGTSLLV